MRTPVEFRRLIVFIAVSATVAFTIGLSKHGMGHVDKQIAKQMEELERRAKEMQSPSEQLRIAMYANSHRGESEEDSIVVTTTTTTTSTGAPHTGDKPPSLLNRPEAPLNDPDLASSSSKTLATDSTNVGTMSSQQDIKSQSMEQVQILSPEQMKLLTPEQQQQFLIMQFQRMQYQNQFERMKATISKAPGEVKRLLGMPLETVRRRMKSRNLRHQMMSQNRNLRFRQHEMPAEVIEIPPGENLYYVEVP